MLNCSCWGVYSATVCANRWCRAGPGGWAEPDRHPERAGRRSGDAGELLPVPIAITTYAHGVRTACERFSAANPAHAGLFRSMVHVVERAHKRAARAAELVEAERHDRDFATHMRRRSFFHAAQRSQADDEARRVSFY